MMKKYDTVSFHLGPNIMRLPAVKTSLFFFAVMTAVSLVCGSAQAQDAKAKATAQSKRTTVNFEDQLVEGQTQKPELFYLLQQRNNNFKRLIKLRENFLPEMRKTSEEMNGKESGH